MQNITDIIEYYLKHGFQNTQHYFNLSPKQLTNLLSSNNIDIRDRKTAYKHRGEIHRQLHEEEILDRINILELYEYYKYHNIAQTCRKFKTSEHYIYLLLDSNNLPRLTNVDRKFYRYLTIISKEKLENLFIKYTSIADIRKELHISNNTLKRIAEHYELNIPRYRYFDIDITILRKLYCEDRLSATEICKRLHISPKRLEQLLSDNKIERKPGIFINNQHTTPNLRFEELLHINNITFQREFRIYYDSTNHYKFFSYDFKIGNYLIEINPSVTHNVSKSIRNGQAPVKDIYYHQRKSKVAHDKGYRCIHIWDWNNVDEIVDNIINKEYNLDIGFEKPRMFIYDCKLRKCVSEENLNTVLIYDDGSINRER